MTKKKDVKGQKPLIDTTPENTKALDKKAEQYYDSIRERMKAADLEATEKQELRDLVAKSGLRPLEDGNILYCHLGITVKVEPDKPGKITVTIDDDD